MRDLALKGKRVLVRVDFNVPMSEDGIITSDSRIRAALPTISYIMEKGGIPILASHLGRPKGTPDPKYSLKPVAERLSKLLGRPVKFAPDCIGAETDRLVRTAAVGDVVLLENLRFHTQEESNDLEFSRAVASMVDLYVNDAFGAAHRAHASTYGVARFFNSPAAGLLMEKEINYLSQVMEMPVTPYVAIIGGAKTSDKLGVVRHLLTKVDVLLLGGGIAFTFLKAQGREIGRSIYDDKKLAEAKGLLDDPKLRLPSDVAVSRATDSSAKAVVVPADSIPADMIGLDIGTSTSAAYAQVIVGAKTIVWAGPLGRFEQEQFSTGTRSVAEAVAEATARGAVSVVGGGDTSAALARFGLTNRVSHVSTGGSACLEFLEGLSLPGIAVLRDKR